MNLFDTDAKSSPTLTYRIGEGLGADFSSTSLQRGRFECANGESRVINDYNPTSLLLDYVVIFADLNPALPLIRHHS